MEAKVRQHMRLEQALGVVWTRALEEGITFVSWDHIEFAVKHMTGYSMHYGLTLEILVAEWGWMADHVGAYPHAGAKEVCRRD